MINLRERAARRFTFATGSALLIVTLLVPAGPAIGASTLTFAAAADAYVQSGGPNSNYGTATVLRGRAPSPEYRSYLRFDVSGVSGTVVAARLRLFVTDATRDAGALYPVPTTWSETSITWNTAPALPASPAATIGAAALGWIDIELGAGAIRANGSFGFAIATTSTDSLYASSREGANPPQLIVTLGDPSGSPSVAPSASAAPSASTVPSTPPSALPSASPTATPSATPTSSPSSPPPPPPPSALIIAPTADAQVKQSSPNANYGAITTLRLRGGSTDTYRSYLRFSVAGVTDPIVSARLRLYVTDASTDAGGVFVVPDAWVESTITWTNSPALPPTAAVPSPGKAQLGTWVEWDVGTIVTANGTYSLAVANTSSNSLLYSSREGSSPPQLVITTATTTPTRPSAGFSTTATSGYAPLSVQFTDTSPGATGWAWDFQADGTVDSTARNPFFTYGTPGTYSVGLTVSNAAGSDTLVRTALVTVVAPPPPGPVTGVLVGAGDIASCLVDSDEATAALLDGIAGTVFTAGDNAYETGSATEFETCYEPTWGRHRSRTVPVAGNHEYDTPGASGYYGYFGPAAGDPAKGYSSRDIGGWHIVVLNSNCSKIVGGCAAGGAQEQWLRADLAATASSCTLALWHHPAWSSGTHGSAAEVLPLWRALYEAGAEVVVTGHDHDYERFAPQNASGTSDPAFGLREFVIGTGGKDLRSFASIAANSEVREDHSFGVLKLTLHGGSFDWDFVAVPGSTFSDRGSQPCHGRPAAP